MAAASLEEARLDAIKASVELGSIADSERDANAYGPMASTYGEITPRGLGTLAARLCLGPADAFADLGSGCGKAVVQAVAELDVATGCGVELARSRHAKAIALRESLPTAHAERVSFVHGDCADEALWAAEAEAPLANATVVYVASLLFPRALMERLAARLAAAPRLRAVATLRPFAGGLSGFSERPAERCEMSWTSHTFVAGEPGGKHPGCPVLIYERSPSPESVATVRGWVDSSLGCHTKALPSLGGGGRESEVG